MYSDSLQSTVRKWLCIHWSLYVCALTQVLKYTLTACRMFWFGKQSCFGSRMTMALNRLCNCGFAYSPLDVYIFHDLVFNWHTAWQVAVQFSPVHRCFLFFFKPKPLIFKCILTWAFNVFQQNYSGVCCHWITSFCILGTRNLRVFLITENTSSHLTTCKKTQPKFHCQQLATVWLQCCEHWFYWVWIFNQKEILFPVIKKKKKSSSCLCPVCVYLSVCVRFCVSRTEPLVFEQRKHAVIADMIAGHWKFKQIF